MVDDRTSTSGTTTAFSTIGTTWSFPSPSVWILQPWRSWRGSWRKTSAGGRSATRPRLLPSAGSIFKKIEGVGAGRLIDECGLKGRINGRAQIFEGHANIIVNRGGATACDVMALIDLARDPVQEETGQILVPEITLVGEF